MLLNGFADLQTLIFILIDLTNGVVQADDVLFASEVDILITFLAIDIIHNIAVIDAALGNLQQVCA